MRRKQEVQRGVTIRTITGKKKGFPGGETIAGTTRVGQGGVVADGQGGTRVGMFSTTPTITTITISTSITTGTEIGGMYMYVCGRRKGCSK